MRKFPLFLVSFLVLISCNQNPMRIISPAFENEGEIPANYTCDGQNVNPPLSFVGTPADAQTLALIVDDPDAPAGDWTHWLVWNVDPSTKQLNENALISEAMQGTNDFGKLGWGGPCPPSGSHRYFFRLYALDTRLDLPDSAKKADLLQAMEGHILETAELMGKYKRP